MTDEAATDRAEAWPVESATTVWRSGRVVSVVTEEVRAPDGAVLTRDVIAHPGAVSVLCLDEADRVLVVDQYRHPVGHRLIEPPAGLLDVDGEDPLLAAKRELYEEGHVRAASWWLLTEYCTSPGMTDETLRVYLARDVTGVPESERYTPHGEEAQMSVRWVPLDTLVAQVLAGRLHNPNLVVGVLAAQVARGRGWRDLRPASSPWTFRDDLPDRKNSRA